MITDEEKQAKLKRLHRAQLESSIFLLDNIIKCQKNFIETLEKIQVRYPENSELTESIEDQYAILINYIKEREQV